MDVTVNTPEEFWLPIDEHTGSLNSLVLFASGTLFKSLCQPLYSSSQEGCTRNIVYQSSSTVAFIITRGMHQDHCLPVFVNCYIHHHRRDVSGTLFTSLRQQLYSSSLEGCTHRGFVYEFDNIDKTEIIVCMPTYCNQENLLTKKNTSQITRDSVSLTSWIMLIWERENSVSLL